MIFLALLFAAAISDLPTTVLGKGVYPVGTYDISPVSIIGKSHVSIRVDRTDILDKEIEFLLVIEGSNDGKTWNFLCSGKATGGEGFDGKRLITGSGPNCETKGYSMIQGRFEVLSKDIDAKIELITK